MILVSGSVTKYVELLIPQELTVSFLPLYLIYRHKIILLYPSGWAAESSCTVLAWPRSVQTDRQLSTAFQPMRCSPRALAKGSISSKVGLSFRSLAQQYCPLAHPRVHGAFVPDIQAPYILTVLLRGDVLI